jgi:2'-5' RNA ligase
MRLFAAIDIPVGVKDKLRALTERLRPLASINWSPVDNLHLTTKFIGEWPEARLTDIKTALSTVRSPGEIDIAVGGLGWFPNARNPRVFWAGVSAGESLAKLARSTEEAVAKIGVPVEDRAYSPHFTLARIRDRVPLDALRKATANLESESFGSFRANAFYLYLSAGGKYTKLAEYPL